MDPNRRPGPNRWIRRWRFAGADILGAAFSRIQRPPLKRTFKDLPAAEPQKQPFKTVRQRALLLGAAHGYCAGAVSADGQTEARLAGAVRLTWGRRRRDILQQRVEYAEGVMGRKKGAQGDLAAGGGDGHQEVSRSSRPRFA